VEHIEVYVPTFVAVPHQKREIRVLPFPQGGFDWDVPDVVETGSQRLPSPLEPRVVAAPEAEDLGVGIVAMQKFEPVVADVQRVMESEQDDPLQERLREWISG